jgi:hypothetical protein
MDRESGSVCRRDFSDGVIRAGGVMHTISRELLHEQKGRWTLGILVSRAVRSRMAALGKVQPSTRRTHLCGAVGGRRRPAQPRGQGS